MVDLLGGDTVRVETFRQALSSLSSALDKAEVLIGELDRIVSLDALPMEPGLWSEAPLLLFGQWLEWWSSELRPRMGCSAYSRHLLLGESERQPQPPGG